MTFHLTNLGSLLVYHWTPPPSEEGHSGVVGSPWVFTNLKLSPPSTPANSHGTHSGLYQIPRNMDLNLVGIGERVC